MDRSGPSIVLRVLTFRTSAEKLIGKWIVTVRFDDVDEVELDGFNHQNVFNCMLIDERVADGLEIILEPIFGLGGKFVCQSAEVVEVAPVLA